MFVDPTGRRRRMFKMVAAATGVVLCTAVAVLIAGFLGVAPSALPGLPQLQPAPQEIAQIPEPAPSTSDPALSPPPATGPPATPPGHIDTSPTADKRGNRPTHTPSRPHPGKTK